MRTINATEGYKFSLNQNYPCTNSLSQIYVGSLTRPDIKEKVENAALIILIGGLGTDFNTGNFSYNILTERLVEVRFQNTATQQVLIVSLAPLKPHKSPVCEI
jgi:TPP-dependent 2-oxoacid decarboxylase